MCDKLLKLYYIYTHTHTHTHTRGAYNYLNQRKVTQVEINFGFSKTG